MTFSTQTHPHSMKALVAANRRAGRLDMPQDQPEPPKLQMVGMRLPHAEFERARELARAEDRSVASFCRRMYLRGLAAHLAEQGGAHAQ